MILHETSQLRELSQPYESWKLQVCQLPTNISCSIIGGSHYGAWLALRLGFLSTLASLFLCHLAFVQDQRVAGAFLGGECAGSAFAFDVVASLHVVAIHFHDGHNCLAFVGAFRGGDVSGV